MKREIVTIYEAGDIIFTMSVDGKPAQWKVRPDGSLEKV